MHLFSKPNEASTSTQEAFLQLIEVLCERNNETSNQKDLSMTLAQELIDLAKFHGLEGLLYSRMRTANHHAFGSLEKEWNFHRWTNLLLFENLQKLEADMSEQGIKICRLKGASLIPRIYQDPGERVLSDVDILVTPGHRIQVEEYLASQGYSSEPSFMFKASKHRVNWTRKHSTGLEINFDVHEKSHWQQPLEFYNRVVLDAHGYFRLDDASEILHLIFNWVEQDTLVSFNKMFDIYLAIKKSHLNWDDWYSWIEKLGHERSVRLVQHILKSVFQYDWRLPPAKTKTLGMKVACWIVDANFLMSPQRSKIKYLILKHLTKDAKTALVYDWLWISGLLKQTFNKLIKTR